MAISNSIDRFNGVVASLAIKVRCVVGLAVNVTTPLTGISNPYEGVFLVDGDRVLLTGQTDPIINGIWCVNASGPWSRAADWDGSRDVELGSTVWAGRSGIASDVLWQVTAPSGVIQPGNTAVTITLLLDPDSAGGISGTTIDSTVRFDGVEYVENLNLIVEADGRVTHPNAIATRWLDSAAAPVDLLDYQVLSIAPVGGASAVANFEGTDGDRFYTGEDGRVWTFAGSTGINDISNAQAKFGSTSYDFGGQGAQDDNISTVITAEYNAGNFVPGAKDWFIKFWVWNDSSQVGGHDYGCIGEPVGSRRAIRWSNNNNTVSMAYDATGSGGETKFPTFGAAPTDSVWHEFVFERFGNGIYFYLDGVQQGSTFDCTGDNGIGSGLTNAVKVLMLGSSIQNAVAGITPVPNSYMDSFEMVIGRSLNGGVGPGSPEASPPVADRETLVVGDPASAARIDANNLNINGAYDLPVADGAVGQALVTDGSGTVRFGAVSTNVPDGSALGDVLRWDGVSAYEIANGVHMEATGAPPGANVGYIRFNTTSTVVTTQAQMIWDASNTTSTHYFAQTTAGANGFYLRTRSTSETHAWGVNLGGVESDLFQINEDLGFQILAAASMYISQKGAAGANVASYGQLFVDGADDSLHYITEAGVDFDLTAAGGAPGGATTQIQFNNAGAFDGDANLLWDDVNKQVTISKLGGSGPALLINNLLANTPVIQTGQSGSSTSSIPMRMYDSSGTQFFQWFFDTSLSSGNHKLELQSSSGGVTPFIEFDNSGELAIFGTQATNGLLFTGLTGTKKMKASIPLYFEQIASPGANDINEGQFWVRNTGADGEPCFTDGVGVTTVLNAAAVLTPPIALLDNEQIQFGTGTDVTVDWDGVDLEIEGAAINQIINFRDGFHLVLWDSGNTDNIDIHHDGNDVNVTSAATASITFVDVDIRVDDNVEVQFGTGNDASIRYDGVFTLDLDLITDDVFNIQEAGVDRFGFNHLNNRMELFTGNRLLAYSSDNLEWMEYYHDGSDGHIGTGGTNPGSILLESAIVHVVPTDTVSANAVTLATEDSNGFFVDLEPATAAVVITLGGSPPSGYYVASIRVQQDGATAQTISFAGGVILDAGGTPHPVTTTLDGITIYTVETWDGGTTWHISGVDYS